MEAMKNVFINAINGGNFNLSEMETKIDTLWVKGSLTEAERNELLELAAAKANDLNQIDIVARIAELERRVFALENPPEEEQGEPEVVYPVWGSDYITAKGETVQFDYDKDGNLDLLRYDGGRATTSLSPGKIDGWHVVDSEGNILGTFYKGEFTPVEPQEQPSEGEDEETPTEGNEGQETPGEGE